MRRFVVSFVVLLLVGVFTSPVVALAHTASVPVPSHSVYQAGGKAGADVVLTNYAVRDQTGPWPVWYGEMQYMIERKDDDGSWIQEHAVLGDFGHVPYRDTFARGRLAIVPPGAYRARARLIYWDNESGKRFTRYSGYGYFKVLNNEYGGAERIYRPFMDHSVYQVDEAFTINVKLTPKFASVQNRSLYFDVYRWSDEEGDWRSVRAVKVNKIGRKQGATYGRAETSLPRSGRYRIRARLVAEDFFAGPKTQRSGYSYIGIKDTPSVEIP